MHLLYFVQYFPPENASGLPLITDMIEGFVQNGLQVDVYVPTPTRGVDTETRKKYARIRKEIKCNGNLVIHRMHLYREGKGMLQRTIRYTFFSFQCLFRGLFYPADAVFTGAAPPTQGLVAGLVAKLTSKKVIYNPQDLFPDSLIVAGKATEESKIVSIGRKIERFAYKNVDMIITITEDMMETIRSRVDEKNKVYVVRNWIDTDKTNHVERKNNKLFDELGLKPDKFYVVYAGNLGMVQGVEIIIEAAELLRDEMDINFVIFGNGSEEDHIGELIEKKGLNNVRLFPLQPIERVSEVYSIGDICLITCKKGAGSAGMPSKTWTIMAAGEPIIASFDSGGEMEKVINDANCGYCIEPENSLLLAEKIRQLHVSNDLIKEMSENSRKYVIKKCNKAKSVGEYVRLIENLIEK